MATSPQTAEPVIQVVEATGDIVALDLEGEFDISAAPELTRQSEQVLAAGKNLIINLSDATFIDSSIVHALFAAETEARKAGRAFVLQFGTHAAVERVLEITGTDQALPNASTREAAIGLIEASV
jgi:anti-sigma B factor antagonist